MSYPGKNAQVKIGSDVVGQINDATITVNGELVDVTAFDSAGFRKRLPNLVDATISISGFWDITAGQHTIFRDAILAGTKLDDVTVLAASGTATSGFKCDAYVESFELSPSVEGAVPVSITLQSDGTVAASS